MIDALIFDLDGTLVDSMPAHLRAWRAALTPVGLDFPEPVFYGMAGMPTHVIVETLAREQGVAVDVDAVVADREAHFAAQAEPPRPLEPVMAIAREHRGRLPMAVATGSKRAICDATLAELGITDWFDATVCAEDTERHKPHPDVFLEAARRLGIAPERCRVYEDADFGLEAARRAGMEAVDIRLMGHRREE